MTITAETRSHAVSEVTRWVIRTGVPLVHLSEADRADWGWVRYARCRQAHPAAPDPELFFPLEADQPKTYVARTLCTQCPVRQYCGEEAERAQLPGIWAGVYRDSEGRPAPLCVTIGCINYQRHGHPECGACMARLRAERVSAQKRRSRAVRRKGGIRAPQGA